MIFDVIYDFYIMLFNSDSAISIFWEDYYVSFWNPSTEAYFTVNFPDYFAVLCTVVTIIFGIFALFRILGGVLRLFKV